MIKQAGQASTTHEETSQELQERVIVVFERMGAMRDWRPFLYGGLASCTAECGTFPIDTTKIRLQIQGQKSGSACEEVKYRGMLHALLRISEEEGFRALYSGIAPAVLRQATYGTIKFGVYYSLKKILVKNPEEEDVVINISCGMLAGMVSSAIANPTDVLKVRMQAGRKDPFSATLNNRQPKGLVANFTDVYRLEGVHGLWRGVGPTAQRAAVIAGVELPVYDSCKRHFITCGVFGDTVPNHFVSSFIASLSASIASTPIDVIRTRLMNQRKLKTTTFNGLTATTTALYTGSIDCLMQTVRNEGVMALYKGFIPTWVRMGPWNIIFFVTYEQLKKMY